MSSRRTRRSPRWRMGLVLIAWLGTASAARVGAQIEEPTKPTASASEANPAVPAAGHSIHGEAFNDGPRSRAILLVGQGHGGFQITTKDPEGQKYFDQGVAQLHTFYYLEAERSFRQVAKLDPGCPMAYWGMAMANLNNEKRARGFLKEARKAAEKAKPSKHEQLYLDALAAFYKEKAEEKARRQDYLKGLEAIVQEFPDDLDARAWLAMVTWQNSQKGDGIGSRQAVDEVIESVLRVDPRHPGALHYRIHLWDGVKQDRAVKAAGEYGPAAPAIAHAWHMPGHTYTGLKRYAEAAYQQEASARVDHAAMARDRTLPFEIHNYAHNNQWLCTTLSHLGRARDAITVARNLVEQPRDPQKNGKNDGGSSQRSGRARWSEVLVRYELWDDLVRETESGALDWSDIPLERKEKAYTLGLAYAASGDVGKLAAQIEALKAIQAETKKPEPSANDKENKEASKDKDGPEKDASAPKDAPADSAKEKDADKPYGDAKKDDEKKDDAKKDEASDKPATPTKGKAPRRPAAPPGLASAIAELEGYRLLLDGKVEEAQKSIEKATGMRPEAKAHVLLKLGQAEKAVAVAKSTVEKEANQFPPLACLVETLDAAGKTAEAREAYAKLLPLLRHADADLPVMQRLERLVTRWKAADGWGPSVECDGPASSSPSSPTESFVPPVPLERLGPLNWAPTPAEPFTLADTEGNTWDLAKHRGKNVLVLFYLGGKCAHCMQQLQDFGKAMKEFQALGVDVVGVSTDDLDATRRLKEQDESVVFPMPLLADPSLEVFRRYRCFDDFEGQPLHGTFLIDPEGNVRFRRISADPFLEVKFLEGEVARVNRLLRR